MSIVDLTHRMSEANWCRMKLPARNWLEPFEDESSDESLPWEKLIHRDVLQISRRSSNPCREVVWGIRSLRKTADTSSERIAVSDLQLSNAHLAGIRSYIDTQLRLLPIPSQWQAEGYMPPSSACRDMATELLVSVFVEHHVLPYKIAASRAGGIVAAFRVDDGKRQLTIEVDEDLEACGVVSNEEKVLASGFLDHKDDKRELFEQLLC